MYWLFPNLRTPCHPCTHQWLLSHPSSSPAVAAGASTAPSIIPGQGWAETYFSEQVHWSPAEPCGSLAQPSWLETVLVGYQLMAPGLFTLPVEWLSLPSKCEPVFTLPQADRASCLCCACSVGDPSSRVQLSPSFKAQILIKKSAQSILTLSWMTALNRAIKKMKGGRAALCFVLSYASGAFLGWVWWIHGQISLSKKINRVKPGCCSAGPSNGWLWLRIPEEFAGTSFGKIRFRIINCLWNPWTHCI